MKFGFSQKSTLVLAGIFTLALGCKPKTSETSESSSLVLKSARWPNPSSIQVCIMNYDQVSAELRDDVQKHVTADYSQKTPIRFVGWGKCTAEQKNQPIIRVYYNLTWNWDSPGASAGGGLSWLGPNKNSCGGDCNGGTMRIDIGRRGSYATHSQRNFTIEHTRSTAVHEFGHAVGLAHEHERADAPQCGGIRGDIKNSSSYVFVGNYDPQSIMNYCKTKGVTTLSSGDVAGITYLYGKNTNAPKDPKPDDISGTQPTVKGVYSIVSKHSGKCLDVEGSSKQNYAKILTYDCKGSANQKFRVLDMGGGAFAIQSTNSGKCFDIQSGSSSDGAGLIQYDCHSGNNQRYALRNMGGGKYSLVANHSNRCIDIKDRSKANGAVVHQWRCHGEESQQFTLVP